MRLTLTPDSLLGQRISQWSLFWCGLMFCRLTHQPMSLQYVLCLGLIGCWLSVVILTHKSVEGDS